jgi:hypothetical protein
MHLSLYAHPFDLEALAARGGLAALRDLGFAEIALAVSYHDGRWLMPWHPAGRVRFLEDGTVHFRPRGDYGVLQPLPSSHVPASGPSPLEALCVAAPAAGMRVRAWTVLTHNSRLGLQHPELCVENAFGDRYPYALCPAQPAVQRYILTMLTDLGAHAGLHTIELEALGWMGWKHGSHHDKASFTPRGWLEYALSLCFCSHCRTAMRAECDGADPEVMRAWARDLCTNGIDAADAMAPPVESEPDAEAADAQLWSARAARITLAANLNRKIRAALPHVACAVQVHPATLFTGSQMPIQQTQALRANEYVITAYGEAPAAIAKLLTGETMHLVREQPKRLCIWPKAPQFTTDADLTRVRDLCAEHGIASLAIYHLGLLPWRTLARVAKIFAA